MKFKKLKNISGILAACTLLSGCGAVSEEPSNNLTSSVPVQPVAASDPGGDFKSSQMQFAVNLFRESMAETPDGNVMISPFSVMLALSMTANGAEGQTRAEMEQVLGGSVADLNQNLLGYVQNLPSSEKAKFSVANSIWFRDEEDFSVKPEFLQTDQNYYQADIFQEPFDSATCGKINSWVNQNTDGMISQIIDTIKPDTKMYLINALAFDAEWQHIYENIDIHENQKFTSASGQKQNVTMMHSSENFYLESENAVGFLKPYAEGYSFAALLPEEGLSLEDYLASLTPEKLLNLLENAQTTEVSVQLPKFKTEFDLSLIDALTSMGMPSAFSGADFSGMSDTPLYISDVLHKTYIEVDERGTKAGAVTAVIMDEEGLSVAHEPKFVTLDRPFIYMILDDEQHLPLFIGAVRDIT